MSDTTILLDVCDDIRSGREPLSKIMNAATSLREGQRLLIVAPFEPVPLFSLLNKQGFRHTAKPTQEGNWEVLVVRERGPEVREQTIVSAGQHSSEPVAAKTREIIEVDARGLEPPLPMIKILEALASLPRGAELRGRTDRRPLHLYAQLEERGFAAKTVEEVDGS